MSDRLSWMLLSFPLPSPGTLRVRVNFFFLVISLIFAVRYGWALGLTLVALLLVSVFLHEWGHVVAARLTGGSASEIHLTPLGGLALVQPGRDTFSQIFTAAAGPFMNLLICLLLFPSYYAPETLWGIFNPLVLPVSQLSEDQLLRDLKLLAFSLNWLLLIVNMLPIVPLDGGQILRAAMATRIHPELVGRASAKASLFFSGALMLAGLMGDWSIVVFLGAILMVVNVVQLLEEQSSDFMDEEFQGYDFSEGYTSLDRAAHESATSPDGTLNPLQRWREQRRIKREIEERQQQVDAEQQLDGLLAKVHEHGMASLTAREQRLLQQVSDLLRERGKRPS